MKNRWNVFLALSLLAACLFGMSACLQSSINYSKGLDSYKSHDYANAEKSLKTALQGDPGSKDAKALLAWTYFKQNRIQEAEALFVQLEKQDKDDINVAQGFAWIAYLKGEFDKAKGYFQKEVKWSTEHTKSADFSFYSPEAQLYCESIGSDGNHGLGLVAKAKGNPQEAIQSLGAAVKLRNQFTAKSKILTDLGDIYSANKKEAEALSAYERAAKEEASEGKPGAEKGNTALLKLGWAQYGQKKFAQAEESFSKALLVKPGQEEGLYGLTLAQYEQAKADQAYGSLAKLVAINPFYPEAAPIYGMIEKKTAWRALWKDWGLAYYRLGYYSPALFRLLGYLKDVKPNDIDALMAAGWCYRWLGYLDKAMETFKAAGAISPSADEVQVGLGSTYLGYGRARESKEAFDRALQMNPGSHLAHNGLAYYYSFRKDTAKTEESLRKALGIKKEHYDSQAFLANLLYGEKRYQDAAVEYARLTEMDRMAVAPWNSLGWASYYGSKYEDALKAFEESKRRNPYLADAHYGLGITYAKLGKKDEAKKEFVAAINIYPYYSHTQDLIGLIKQYPDWVDLYATLGWSYYYYLQYALAGPAFEEYSKARKDDAVTRPLAWCKYFTGQLDQAYAMFQDLLKKDPNDVDAMVGCGWVLFYKNKDDEAMQVLQNATKQKPELADAWRTISAIAFRKKDYKQAEAVSKKIAELQPLATDSHNNQGWAFYHERNYKEAIEKFNKSIQIYRYYGEPHYGLALCHLKMNETDKAVQELTTAVYLYPAYMDGEELYKIIKDTPKLKGLHNDLGWSYYNQFNYKAAGFHFDRALKNDPRDPIALLGLGTVDYVLGDFKGAAEKYDKLTPQVPATSKQWDKWSYMLDNLGWSWYSLKNYEKAISSFERLERYHPEIRYVAPLNGRAWSEFRKGNKDAARKLFEESLKIFPGNYSAEAGIAALKN